MTDPVTSPRPARPALPDAADSRRPSTTYSAVEPDSLRDGDRRPARGESGERTEAIRRRDPDALEAVVRETLPALVRAARGAGLSLDRAEDAAQETLLAFLAQAERFDGQARILTYLFGILFHKIGDERRREARDARADPIDEVVESRFAPLGRWRRPPAGPAADLGRAELARYLTECLEGVPERQRAAFVLREVEGLDTEEVCKVLEVTANNLGVLLYRARNRLRECLESRGIEGSRDAEL
jgi:RNA polymerase sigma-70 factor, ECF subfamily